MFISIKSHYREKTQVTSFPGPSGYAELRSRGWELTLSGRPPEFLLSPSSSIVFLLRHLARHLPGRGAQIWILDLCGLGALWVSPPDPQDPVLTWCSWKQVLQRVRRAGKLHTCHTMTWPQMHRLRYKDKYKYYSQNL